MDNPASRRPGPLAWIRFTWQTAGKNNLLIGLLTLVQILLSSTGVCYALLLRELVDGAAAGNRQRFLFGAFWFISVAAAQILLAALRRFLRELTGSSLENRFKKRLFTALLDRNLGDVAAVHTARWMNYLTSDTSIVAENLTELLPELFGMTVQLGTALAALLILEPRLGWLVLPAGLILLVFSTLFRSRMKSLHKKIQESDGDLRQTLQEALTGMTVVRAYAAEEQIQAQAGRKMALHKRARMRRSNFSNLCNIGFGFLMNGAYVLGALFCSHGILVGTMGLGNLVAVMQLVGQIQSPMANISSIVPRYYRLQASTERLMEAEALPHSSGPAPLPAEEALRFYRQDFSGLSLEHISFTYPDKAAPALRDFSLHIGKQEYIALTGPSGCGKSTVFRLLLGLYSPQRGCCRILSSQGQSQPAEALRRMFAYVPQGVFFMNGTIRQVVAFSEPRRAKEDSLLWQALETACAADFVRALPQGLDTPLGEQGLGLSEGQLQRLSIARAIFSQRPVLLLDEATSALDEATEKTLLQNLRSMTQRTVLIVTHRPAAFSICDRVIDFETQEGALWNSN